MMGNQYSDAYLTDMISEDDEEDEEEDWQERR